ncbi:MAG: ribonuclease HII [Bacteroidales bacterium]
MLKQYFTADLIEAGCDEAGRGCLAGAVFAAAVILPKNFSNELLNDSKKMTLKQRKLLRTVIENEALAYAVATVDNHEIDRINILNASFKAMQLAVMQLSVIPELLLIDGNRFRNTVNIPHKCFVEGDGIFMSIAAASVLAKTYRDDYMDELDNEYPVYGWKKNKGYPTKIHKEAIIIHGCSQYHRITYKPCSPTLF